MCKLYIRDKPVFKFTTEVQAEYNDHISLLRPVHKDYVILAISKNI